MNLESIQNDKTRMIFKFSIPSIIAMILTSLITVADGFFIGNYVGGQGIAAVNLGLPIVYLYLAVGLMVSVGGVAIAGMALGGGDTQRCNDVFNQTMATAVAASVLISVIMRFCLDPMLGFLQADAVVAGYFKAYYMIMLLVLPVMVINASFGMFIRGDGKPQYFMQVSILNVLLNILLNYCFVRLMEWGVKGVALASLISALAALVCTLYFFIKKSSVYKLRRFIFSGEALRSTILNGGSEFIGEMSLCISMFAYNYVILKNIGVDALTAFTIVGYAAYMFSMIVIGFGQGSVVLFSFAYGAKAYSLAAGLRRITSRMVLLAGIVVFGLMLIGRDWYGSLFVDSEAVEELVRSGIAIFGVSFLLSGVNVIASFYFTSIGKAVESAVISGARGFVILLACIFILPPLLGMTGIWLAAPVTEGLTLFLSLLFIRRDKTNFPLRAAGE